MNEVQEVIDERILRCHVEHSAFVIESGQLRAFNSDEAATLTADGWVAKLA